MHKDGAGTLKGTKRRVSAMAHRGLYNRSSTLHADKRRRKRIVKGGRAFFKAKDKTTP